MPPPAAPLPNARPDARRPPRRQGRLGAALVACGCVGAADVAHGQAAVAPGVGVPAATIAVTDPATALVEQMLALVPVRGGIVGQRPYATREAVRLATAVADELTRRRRARGEAAELTAAEERAATLARALLAAYVPAGAAARAPAVTWRPLDFAWAHGVGAAEAARTIPSNGLGLLDARTLPPLDLRFGRPAVQGAVGSIETAHALGIGGWLAVVAQPRASLVVARRGGTRVNVEPQRLYARAVAGNVAVQAGVDEWAWGQGGGAGARPTGAFLSGAARPLRALSVGADTAFALPGWFARLGRWRAALLVADLGRDQNFPHAKLAAYKLNLAPTPTLEFGAGLMSHLGGRGAPPLAFGDRVRDLFPFTLGEGGDRLSSNKVAALDARVRVPRWRGLTLAWELTADDFDVRRLGSTLWDDSGHLLTLSLPRLRDDGAVALDVHAQRTGIRIAEHFQYTSGLTYRGQLFGDPLGPHASSVGATLTWRPRPFDALALSLTREVRDASVYQVTTTGPNDEGFGFTLRAPRPVERRLRAAVLVERAVPGRGTSASVRIGADRASDRAFVDGLTTTRPFGEAGVRVRF